MDVFKKYMSLFSSFVLIICIIINVATGFDYDYVTCGSVVKLLNVRNNVRLHSHDVKYGSGSQQQSVTAVDNTDDNNSYWKVRGKTNAQCMRGHPIKCGQTIRLTHIMTDKNLHSHRFQSPLSHNLEVSAFGDSGEGDEGDNWAVVCTGSDKHWRRDENIRLKHVVTDNYLHVSGDSYGRPIYGQREVSCYPSLSDQNYWKVMEGIYVKPIEMTNLGNMHDEL